MSIIPPGPEPSRASVWLFRLQCACTLLVALIAAYVSYRHGQAFALKYGADETTALLWPLVVDGLLTMATVELWATSRRGGGQWKAWTSFALGIGLSLCANIASAPEMSVFGIAVAACPPLALLLSVELLNQALKRHRVSAEEQQEPVADAPADGYTNAEGELPGPQEPAECTAANSTAGQSPDHHDHSMSGMTEGERQFALALEFDAEHWRTYGKRIPHETLRRKLKVSSARAREVNKRVRARRQRQVAATRLEPETARPAAVPVPTG